MPEPRDLVAHSLSPDSGQESEGRTFAAAATPKTVRLIVVRGSRKGRQYTLAIAGGERAVVGKRSTCDCVLGEEGGIDAVQFELLNEGGDIHILNLSNRMPTLLAGRPLDDKTRLHSDALVGTGETILRIVF